MPSGNAPQFSFADELANPCLHCATFARFMTQDFMARGVIPRPEDPTATVTFIEIEGRTYAVTAAHVIEQLEKLAIRDGTDPEGYFVPVARGVAIHPPFVRPPSPIVGHQPDVAMRPVDAQLPPYVGKQAFAVKRGVDPTFPLACAMAAGFPTFSKFDRTDAQGTRLAMTGVRAVAEGVGSGDGDQVQFFSEIAERPPVGSLSGMSGGPVYWSDGTNYGLLGFIKEAMDVEPKPGEETLFNGPRVNFICQRASFDTLLEWAAYVDQEFPKQRKQLNDRVRAPR